VALADFTAGSAAAGSVASMEVLAGFVADR
jgi:hypothetical protein